MIQKDGGNILMESVFISYRRNTGSAMAQLLEEKLTTLHYSVFLDYHSLGRGLFNEQIIEKIKSADDFILILSSMALENCYDVNDWLRKEILCALNNNINIVPVFISGFTWPDNLPAELQVLKNSQGVNFNFEYTDASIDRIQSFMIGKNTNYDENLGLISSLRTDLLSLVKQAYKNTISLREAFKTGNEEIINQANSELAMTIQCIYYFSEEHRGSKEATDSMKIVDTYNIYVSAFNTFSNSLRFHHKDKDKCALVAEKAFSDVVDVIIEIKNNL